MSPYNSYQENWNEDCVTQEKHIDEDNEGAAWINNAKDRTQSIISNLDSQEEPSQLKDFYDSETFESRFGQESVSPTDKATSKNTLHHTPTIIEGQETASNVCSCCQLPIAPKTSQGTPQSPSLHHTPKDSCFACYCPDIKMPKEMMDSPPSQKPHIRRHSSLSNEGFANWHRRHNGEIKCAEREDDARNEMSIGAWL